MGRACELARIVPTDDEEAARRFFESTFQPYALVSSDGPDTGLITGYYEPVIDGSRSRSATHPLPILGVPDDLIVVDLASVNPDVRNLRLRGRLEGRRLVPYYSRGEIEARNGSLPAPVIAWTSDAVELFFLQIQGSGQVQFEDGTRIRIGYADQNGHPFRSLGRYLVERGELTLDQASMQGIKTWAAANPGKLQDALDQNPS
ncbi:MAG: MltA domain-containing protein, partial [Clostridia bacterium]